MRATKSVRDRLKAEGKWNVEYADFSKDSSSAGFDGAAEFCRLADEANAVDFRADFDLHEVAIDPICFSEALDSSLSVEGIDPFPDGLGFDKPKSFYLSQSFIVGAMYRVLNSSGSDPGPALAFEAPVPNLMVKYLEPIGEFESGDTHFVYPDIGSELKALLRVALDTKDASSCKQAVLRSWLPVTSHDMRSKIHVARAVAEWFGKSDVRYECVGLQRFVFSGVVPGGLLDAVSRVNPTLRQSFEKLFLTFKDGPSFFKHFADPQMLSFFSNELELNWPNPDVGHLYMNLEYKEMCVKLFGLLPESFLGFKGKKVTRSSFLIGKGSRCQLIRHFKDVLVKSPFQPSVEEVVQALCLHPSVVSLDTCAYVYRVGFDPRAEFQVKEDEVVVTSWMD